MSARSEPVRATDATSQAARQRLVVAGGLLGSFAASSCCIIPLVLFSLGAGGAWIGKLTALAPYQPIFVTFTLAFLSYGYWLVYRRPKAVCAEGDACAHPLPRQSLKLGLWVATLIVAAALAFPFVAPILLGV